MESGQSRVEVMRPLVTSRQLRPIIGPSGLDETSVALISVRASLLGMDSSQTLSDCSTARVGDMRSKPRIPSAPPTAAKTLSNACNMTSKALDQIDINANTTINARHSCAICDGFGSSVREGADRIDELAQFGIGAWRIGEKPALKLAVFAGEQALEGADRIDAGAGGAMREKTHQQEIEFLRAAAAAPAQFA
jgi:hypothetical protein